MLGPERFDVVSIVDRINAYEDLDTSKQDAVELWEYAGLYDAEHPLTSLLPEYHNTRVIVRDLNGPLQFICEDPAARVRGETVWSSALLVREDLVPDDEIEWYLGDGDTVDPARLARVMAAVAEVPRAEELGS